MIDLHLHLDGSLRPATAWELLRNKNIINFNNIDEARTALEAPENCKDLNEYLKRFDYPIMILQQEEEIIRAVKELGEDLAGEGTDYAEIRFAPMFSTREGLAMEEVAEAAMEGVRLAEKEYQVRLKLILCCMRGADEKDNMKTVECARKYLGQHVCALDLAGAEGIYPTELYKNVFREAAKHDIPFTIHAGEAAGPESIWTALEFGASRIGHGIRCVEDRALMDYLVRNEIPLEVCPISNMQTKVYSNPDFYPLKELLENGVHVTLNTDNRTVSNTSLLKERTFAADRLRLTEKDIKMMEEYSEKAAFVKR